MNDGMLVGVEIIDIFKLPSWRLGNIIDIFELVPKLWAEDNRIRVRVYGIAAPRRLRIRFGVNCICRASGWSRSGESFGSQRYY